MYPGPLFWNVHTYGLMIAIGLICLFIVLFTYGKKIGMKSEHIDFVFYLGFFAIALGFGSAALFQSVYNYIDDVKELGSAAKFSFDGSMTFIGGLIGGVAVFLILYNLLKKKYPVPMTQILGVAPCCITVTHAFGRIGCFFAGCCYGKETDSFLGVQFPDLPAPVHATQLYEAAFLFVLFAVLSFLLLKKGFKHNMSVYLICYGIFRFCNEFLRGDYRGNFLGIISPSQFWSLCMIALGVGVIYIVRYLLKKEAKTQQPNVQ